MNNKKKRLTKGPNNVSRVVWTRFRHPCPPYHIYSIIQPIYICKTLISMKKHEEKKKNSPRVQTTQDASFGPVFIIPALPISYLVENILDVL